MLILAYTNIEIVVKLLKNIIVTKILKCLLRTDFVNSTLDVFSGDYYQNLHPALLLTVTNTKKKI